MKIKKIFFTLVLIILMQSAKSDAWDTTAAKFYPLNVGNVYVYDYYSLWLNCNPFEFVRKYRVEINDYILKPNGKKYFKFSGWWQGGSIWKFQRVDSNSMNVYGYDSVTNIEYLLDSLLANSGNSFRSNRFNPFFPNGLFHSNFTTLLFGTQIVIKGMSSTYLSIGHNYSLGEGFGFLGFSSCELGSGPSYSLKGCIINGVVYGDTLLTGIQSVNSSIPEMFNLDQNYPNPFNPVTHLEFGISNLGFVSLKVYDALGKEVKILVNEVKPAGNYEVEFDGSDLPGGIYFYKLQSGDFVETKRMILLK